MKRTHTTLFMAALLICCVFTSGCATVLTHSFPPVTETIKGESIQGDIIGYTYSVSETKDGLTLMRQPLCREKIQITEVKRKQLHGVMGALIEIPFFGFGILDLATAGVYSKMTLEEIPKDPIPGSELSPCGDMEPVPDFPVVIQYPASVTTKHLQTGQNGEISYSTITPLDMPDNRLTLFVRDSNGLHYVTSFNYDFL